MAGGTGTVLDLLGLSMAPRAFTHSRIRGVNARRLEGAIGHVGRVHRRSFCALACVTIVDEVEEVDI